ncbi:MAG: Uma2 family endonuclease [Microcoleus sp. PH2017_10_PVI_O_A]|uniref:Uma2 family endonuclease n=1 Tax=unclassified Microcoleus TaxID=2642155 RepID=UPI001D93F744|nr:MULTISPECIES: Uma2 family endonuclease [unclassified Microcoleus]TAE83736.1 MAG: Uma2 family endonuclease [Oscillatoriales cyanobacterium]MCC3405932.1 Uma2 family endonuclease [Microcoleus sp. PH2017_10_PVI_O_A]MCC3459977.1 Uma2 family endonuclease [Microcoleus sp. PH2017_11_PCY_U_A]MCC3478491.1 Uma2 family endonuclease [Microcoleus sp. PH2017_12_PCY_D_A]MCC3527951.1 Uma2 family endonuclease [Microcoleus sp. PH2017_21_RUC_O_A]
MLATTSELPKIEETALLATATVQDNLTIEDFMANPPKNMEWVDGQLVEKNGVTVKHSKIQSRLSFTWANYMIFSKQGGEAYISPPCRTNRQVRRPDVAYLTPELVAQFGDVPTLPQSFPLIAEIISPTDIAEDVFLKAQEYLASSCQEVWLVFPESHLVFAVTQNQILGFRAGETVSTQQILAGFTIAVDELLA